MNWFALAAIGGVVGIDATSVPQAMLSRPLVAGTLGGLAVGRPAEGLLVGAVLEIFSLVILPFGAARYPESGTAATAAAASYGLNAGSVDAPLLLLTVAFALVWEQVAGSSVIMLRRLNERLVADLPDDPEAESHVARRQLAAIVLDFARASAIVVAGVLIGSRLLGWLRDSNALDSDWSGRVIASALLAMLGATLPLFGGLRGRPIAFGAGLAVGLALLVL